MKVSNRRDEGAPLRGEGKECLLPGQAVQGTDNRIAARRVKEYRKKPCIFLPPSYLEG
jgi:hypothetical protein